MLFSLLLIESNVPSKTRTSRKLKPVNLPLVLVLALTLVAMLCFDRPLVVGDGPAYLFWLDSLARDGDLNLANQAEQFAGINRYHIYLNQETGRWASAFPLGVSLILVPFYWLGILLDKLPLFRINDAYFIGLQGVPFAYSLMIMVGVNVYALLSVRMGYAIARRFARPWTAALATIAAYLGTPLFFYTTVETLTSHIGGAFAATLFVWLWLKAREYQVSVGRVGPSNSASSKGPYRDHASKSESVTAPFEATRSTRIEALRKTWFLWLLVGLAAGLTALCRWQVTLIALPVGIELLLHRRWRETLALGLGFLLLAWIIPYSWWQMFGSPFVVPAAARDNSEFLLRPIHTWRVLFHPIAGLFPWSPVTALAILGLIPLLWHDWKLSLIGAAMFLSQALISGSVRDWWAGAGFGMRRMVELYPLYVWGLAVLLGMAAKRWRWMYISLLVLTLLFTVYGVALVLARMNFTWTNPWGLARDLPWVELRYTFSKEHWPVMWPVMKDHVGIWAWKKPGP